MTYTPLEHVESLRIGVVDFVSPDEIKVALDIEAPDSVALNAGGPRPFPRVNSYVLIPADDGYLVGQVQWLTVERSPFPKRRGMQDFGLIDLPYPLRKMSLSPLGMLRKLHKKVEEYSFRRGADALPSIGASVILPTEKQLISIVDSANNRRVKIGTSPIAGNADVCIDPDRLFGRHLAVLGNTGSGKSCSVAGLVRWSLEQSMLVSHTKPNARFVILDPNGEYSSAFDSKSKVGSRVFTVNPSVGEQLLQVPLWFWNSSEWCSFTLASTKTQRPLLKRALREIKSGHTDITSVTNLEKRLRVRRKLSSAITTIQRDMDYSTAINSPNKFGPYLKAVADDLRGRENDFPDAKIEDILASMDGVLGTHQKQWRDKANELVTNYNQFIDADLQPVVNLLKKSLDILGGTIIQDGPDEDVPVPFDSAEFADHLQVLADRENQSQYTDFLITRIRTFLSDSRMNAIVGDTGAITLDHWLNNYVGNHESDENITIIDLSLVPTEVVHVVTAVIARLIFEALQRYRKLNGTALPTVLIMEEAHTFIKRYKEDVENQDAASVCCQVFERIAREGRKFGLGLVLSSQRPSELSSTVLSQCNTFLLHRISNDRDQEQVNKLVPDNLRGLLRELPSLPSQNAILLGWASELPVLVKMNDLPQAHRPHSEDPDFWNVWTRQTSNGDPLVRSVDWKEITDEWQGVGKALDSLPESAEEESPPVA